MVYRREVMVSGIRCVCVVLVAAAVGGGAAVGAECERGRSWWDRAAGACRPCARCAPRLAVLLPCEPHRDTVCHSLEDVRRALAAANNYSRQLYDEYGDYESEPSEAEEADVWDLQTPSLVLAASGCVVFFLVVLVLSLYHAKQWRILKQALHSDVQDLTAKLRLMESGAESPGEVVPSDHHIYCNIHAAKETLLVSATIGGLLQEDNVVSAAPTHAELVQRPAVVNKFGNVYTQEKHPT